MTTKYTKGDEVPGYILATRLDELSEAVRRRDPDWVSEFTMRVPAEVDRDADLVLSEAARRIRRLQEIEVAWSKVQQDLEGYDGLSISLFEDLMNG